MKSKGNKYRAEVININDNTIVRYEDLREQCFAIRVPRKKDYNYLCDLDVNETYIYILTGHFVDKKGRDMCGVYVGQASSREKSNTILMRIVEHVVDKGWEAIWDNAIVLYRVKRYDEAELNYLENAVYNLLIGNDKCVVWNDVRPRKGHPDDEKKDLLDEDIECW